MNKVLQIAAAASLVLGTSAQAAKVVNLQPVEIDGQTVRFEKGIPTIEDEVARVMPIRDLDHGSMQFLVAVYNTGETPFNFGVENVRASFKGAPLEVFSRDQLEQKAKSRAMWSQIGYAVLAGAAAASQNNNYTATTYTPRGVYRTVVTQPGLSGGQVATLAAGGGAIALSQIGLQRTLEALGDEIVQTTTVDPNSGYGGRIVIGKAKGAKPGDKVTVQVDVGGSVRDFSFVVR
jgi:hypothetical protein